MTSVKWSSMLYPLFQEFPVLLMLKSLGVQHLIKFEHYQAANMKHFLPIWKYGKPMQGL